MECGTCKYFFKVEGRSGMCMKRPYVSTRRGGVQMINGKPRPLILYRSHKACSMFKQGGDE